MLGAVIGDICGSVYEFNPVQNNEEIILFKNGVRFTDDTVLSIAVADSFLHNKDLATTIKEYYRMYPKGKGYGPRFFRWVISKKSKPYNSFGNGAAMRVSSVAYLFDSLDEVLQKAKESAEITHNHIEGIKSAQAVALAIFLSKEGYSKNDIKNEITTRFGYDLDRTLEEIKIDYSYTMVAQKSVPEAIISFLESNDFESAIKNAISLKGDADTQACIAGSIAEAYYKKIPQELVKKAYDILPQDFTEIIKKVQKQI